MWIRASTAFRVGIFLLALSIIVGSVERTFFRAPTTTHPPMGSLGTIHSVASVPAASIANQAEEAALEQQDASAMLSEAAINVRQALVEIEAWERDVVPLTKNSQGKTIAAKEDLANEIAHLFRGDRITAESLVQLRGAIDSHQAQIDALASESPTKRVPAAEMRAIRQLAVQAREAAQDWDRAVEGALAIAREAQRPEERFAGTPSLGETISQLNDQAAIHGLKQDREDTKKEEELAKEKAAKLAEEEELERESKEKLVEEARSPEVQSALAPFLAHRNLQPRLSGASVRFEKTFEQGPMSLSRLQGVGALGQSIDGLKMLARVGTSRRLPQPRWDFQSYPTNWSEDNEELLREAQDYLRRLGPTLISEGLLSR